MSDSAVGRTGVRVLSLTGESQSLWYLAEHVNIVFGTWWEGCIHEANSASEESEGRPDMCLMLQDCLQKAWLQKNMSILSYVHKYLT